MRFLTSFLVVLFSSFLCFSQNACQIPVYDGFDYAIGQSVAQKNGGNGWMGPWEVQNAMANTNAFGVSDSSPLSYGLLAQTGGYLNIGNNFIRAGRLLNVGEAGPFVGMINDNGAIGKAGATIYFSALLSKNSNSNSEVWVGLHGQNLAYWEGSNFAKFGYFGSASETGNTKFWSININNAVYQSNIPIVLNEAVLLVVKMQWLSDDNCEFSFFINPSELDAPEPSNATYSQMVSNFQLRGINMLADASSFEGKIDELRFTKSFKSAVPDDQINYPPLASFSPFSKLGLAPYELIFNSSSSSDCDGSITERIWDFGDGQYSIEPNPIHVYQSAGEYTLKLKVFDDMGDSSEVSTVITVLSDVDRCKSLILSVEEAHCGMDNGKLALEIKEAETFELRKEGSLILPLNNTGYPINFENLSVGNYTLTFYKESPVCLTKQNITIHTDSSTCDGWSPKFCDLKMGIGLSGLYDYSRENPFIDQAKLMRCEIYSYSDGQSGCCDTTFQSKMIRDTSGYLTKVPFFEENGIKYKAQYVLSADGRLKDGQYVLFYEGEGLLYLEGVLNQNHLIEDKKIYFTVSNNPLIFLKIDSSQLGNHLRNIRVLPLEYENSTEVFDQTFLNYVKQFSTLRFMDWQETNGNQMISWSQRRKKNYYTQSTYDLKNEIKRGVAYEYIIELANLTRKDIWICVPHLADSTFIANMAVLFRDSLKFGQKVFLEYSNEMWNGAFEQTPWQDTQRGTLSRDEFYTQKAKIVFDIWHSQWANEKDRVKRVLCTHARAPFYASSFFSLMAPEDFDHISASFYFGDSASKLAADTTDSYSILEMAKKIKDSLDFPNVKRFIKLSKLHNKDFIHYEGGQHIVRSGNQTEASYQAQILPIMYDLYQEAFDSLRTYGSTLAMAYNLIGRRQNIHGSWGHLEFQGQNLDQIPAPKFQALMDNTCRSEPCVSLSKIQEDILAKENYFRASEKIEIKSKIANQTYTSLVSDHQIELLPGFASGSGAIFKAEIGGCHQ